jgi:hypothetical protein
MVQKINDMIENGVKPKPNKKKPTAYWDLKGERDSQKKRHRDLLAKLLKDKSSKISDLTDFLDSIGLEVGDIPILKKETTNNQNDYLVNEKKPYQYFKKRYDNDKEIGQQNTLLNYNITNITKSEILQKESDILLETVKLKDKHLISDNTYNEFQKNVAPNNPKVGKVVKERHRQNKSYMTHYRNNYGSYVDGRKQICQKIKKNFKRLNIEGEEIRVKLCGDGTRVGEKLKKLNLCFTLPDSGLVSKSVRGNYTLGIFKIKKENYENLSDCLKELSDNLTEFSQNCEISIDDTTYKIKFLLGGDMAFLHEMMGLNACNSKHCCMLCKTPKEEFFKNDIAGMQNLKRTKEDQIDCLKNVKEIKFGYVHKAVEGYLHPPIFGFISFDDIVFDTLHLSLRLPGKLIKLIFNELTTLDYSDGMKPTTNVEDTLYQKQFFFALDQIGISNPYSYVNNEEINQMVLKIRSFNGDESLLIMENLDYEKYFPINCFPKFNKSRDFTNLCKHFHEIFSKIKAKFYIDNIKACENDTGNWLKLFLTLFHGKHVTPYAHLFVAHLADLIKTFGDVDIYNIQGLEKLNDLTTKEYYRATNRKKFCTYQMLMHRLRIEHDENEEDFKLKTVVKRYKTSQLKKEIREEESKKSWIQFYVNGTILKNTDINLIGTNNSSVKVIILFFFILFNRFFDIKPKIEKKEAH